MLKFLKSKSWVFIYFGVTFVLIPLLVHIAYRTPALTDYFVSIWLCGDILTYYGSIIGVLSTIIIFSLTIQYNRESDYENRKNSVRPYLSSEHHPLYKLIEVTEDKDLVFITVSNNISSSKDIPYGYKSAYTHNPTYKPNKNIEKRANFIKTHHVLSYTLSNVGAGNAVNVDIKINNKLFMPSFAISTNKDITLIFVLLDKILEGNRKTIELRFEYEDILSTGLYYQTEKIEFFRDEKDDSLSTSQNIEWLLSKPQEMDKKEKDNG